MLIWTMLVACVGVGCKSEPPIKTLPENLQGAPMIPASQPERSNQQDTQQESSADSSDTAAVSEAAPQNAEGQRPVGNVSNNGAAPAPGGAVGANAAPPPPVPDSVRNDPDFQFVGFEILGGYELKPFMPEIGDDDPPPVEKIPDNVHSLEGKSVAVIGYMGAYDLNFGRVSKFMLMRDQRKCCYGGILGPHEWIDVQMPEGESAENVMDVPTVVRGRLHIDMQVDRGFVTRVYTMTAEQVESIR